MAVAPDRTAHCPDRLCRPAEPERCSCLGCSSTNSNRGGIISGSQQTFPVMSTLRNRSEIWWISIRVLWRMTKWWCAPTRRPIYNPVHVSLPPNLLVQANPFAWSMATSEQERCIRLLLLILAREGLRSHRGAQAAKRVHRLAHLIGSGDSTLHSSHLAGPR